MSSTFTRPATWPNGGAGDDNVLARLLPQRCQQVSPHRPHRIHRGRGLIPPPPRQAPSTIARRELTTTHRRPTIRSRLPSTCQSGMLRGSRPTAGGDHGGRAPPSRAGPAGASPGETGRGRASGGARHRGGRVLNRILPAPSPPIAPAGDGDHWQARLARSLASCRTA